MCINFCWVSDCWIWGVREPPPQREDRAWGGRSKCHCSSILYGDIIRQFENLPCYHLDLDNRYAAMQVGHEWFTCRRLMERFILFAQHWAMALWHCSSGAFSGCWTNSGGRAAHDATAAGKGLMSSKSSKCWSWCGNLQKATSKSTDFLWGGGSGGSSRHRREVERNEGRKWLKHVKARVEAGWRSWWTF